MAASGRGSLRPADLEEDAKKAELMEEVSIDVLPGVKPWLVEWTRCSDSGGLCDCPGTIRYGHAGEKHHYEDDGVKNYPQSDFPKQMFIEFAETWVGK